MIPCCKLEPKTFFLNSIKKVIIFITWKNDPKIGFSKLYFINCDLISTNGLKESLFENAEYSETKLKLMSEAKKSESKSELKPDTSKMEYRYLGNSGLRVSVLGFGNAVNYRNDKTTVESIFRYGRDIWNGHRRNQFG